jgi:sRNA-binding protein
MMKPMRALVLVAMLAACGPVAYIGQVTLRADDAVEAARAAEADKYSPYWWTRATQYLHMAREVAGHADYQGANHFGRLAEEAANKAREEAEVAAKDPAKRPVPPDAIAPAKDPKDGIAPAKDAP